MPLEADIIKSPHKQIHTAEKGEGHTNGTSAGESTGCPVQDKAPPPPDSSQTAEQAIRADGRSRIYLSTVQVQVNDEIIKVLASDPDLYQRAGWLVQVMKEPPPVTGKKKRPRPRIRALPQATLQEKMTKLICFLTQKQRANGEGGELVDVPVHPPAWCVRGVHARGRWEGIRRLEGIADFPLWLGKGRVLSQPGYDADSELYQCYHGPSLDLPMNPDQDDAKEAFNGNPGVCRGLPVCGRYVQIRMAGGTVHAGSPFCLRGNGPLLPL